MNFTWELDQDLQYRAEGFDCMIKKQFPALRRSKSVASGTILRFAIDLLLIVQQVKLQNTVPGTENAPVSSLVVHPSVL